MAVKTYGKLVHAATDRATQWVMVVEPHVAIRVKRIFRRVRVTQAGAIWINDTPEVARDIEWLLDRWPLDMTEQTRARLYEQANAHRKAQDAVTAILAGEQRSLHLAEPARPARLYQQQAADLALATGRLLLTDDVGLGKSMSGLMLLRDPSALPALVVTLTHLPRQWLGELEKTWPLMLGHILRNGAIYDPAERCRGHNPDVVITSYSKIAKWRHHLAGKFRTVIFDEIQELRRRDSDRYQAAAHIAAGAAYRVGLTATPVYNYAGEIHNILEVLAPDALGSPDEFMREWSGHLVGYGKNVAVRDAGALGAYLRDEGLMLRRTRKQVGREIPEPVVVEQPIDTNRHLVDQAARDVSDMARLVLAPDTAWRERGQAALDMDWRMRHATGVAKAPFVADFVRLLLESEQRVVLYGWHRDVYDIWAARLADMNPAFYTGEESPTQKHAAVEAFTSGDARVLCVSLRAGAGLDGLQNAASVAVFGELDWSPGIHEQCIGRLWRDGQDCTVVAYYLVSDAGTDPLMTEALGIKDQQARALRGDESLFNVQADSRDRVRHLAEAVLAKNGAKR